MVDPREPRSDQALRLVVEWDGRAYVTRSVERLLMRVPGVSRFESRQAGTGRFVDVRGEDGELLHRHAIDGQLPEGMSYPTGDPSRPTARAAIKPGMTFTILVPAHPRASALALVELRGRPQEPGSRKRRGPSKAKTTELALKELLVVPLSGEKR